MKIGLMFNNRFSLVIYSVFRWYCQYETQNPKIPSMGGMIYKRQVLEASEFLGTAITVWHTFGHFWQPALWQKSCVHAGCIPPWKRAISSSYWQIHSNFSWIVNAWISSKNIIHIDYILIDMAIFFFFIHQKKVLFFFYTKADTILFVLV